MSRAFSVRAASRSAHAVSTSARSAVTSSGRISGLVSPGLSHRVGPVYQLNLHGRQKDAGALMKGRGHSAGQLRPPYPRGVDPPPIEPFKQRRKLRRGQPHHPVADRRPFEFGSLEPLPDQHQAGPVINQHLHPVRSFRAENEDRAAEWVLLEHRLHRRCQAIGATPEINRTRRNQHSHPRRRRPSEGRDHFIAFNRRSTLPRKLSSTPASTRRVAPPISISIAVVPKPPWFSITTGTKSDATRPASVTAPDRN